MIGTVLNDRYSIQSLIGRGGMGAVYQAEDILLERPVAIKVVSATDLGTESRTRLLQEARAAARINHPNIVAVFDIGQAEFKDQPGCSYIVMELVRGQTLRDAMPQDLDRIIDIAIKICQALAAAEQHGIIHRDLKPENIMIADGDSIKLMDFGLARISGKARLTQEGTLMGTLSYLAPEVILGQEADPRSDLYALGVTLYEMSAGRPPFEADNLTAVISQHLIAPIVPPSAYNDRIPPVLDQLIIQLLGKHPEDRPSSAEAVQVALEDISKASFVSQTVQPIPQLNRLIRGRMVGREQELAEAHACWNQAISGRGQVLLVSGEPGIGKTRLIHELITLVRVSGGRVLSGASYAEGGAPYAPFSQILREGLREEDLSLSGELLAGLLTLVPELRSRYPQLPDRTPGDPQEEQQRLLDNIVHYFSLLSDCAPLLLVLEDAHWADSGTVSLLRHLARGCRLQSLMVAATYREVEIDEARALHRALLDMQRERLAARIKLSRLDREGTRALMATLFDEAIAPDFLEGIYHETEGNPFFIEEICKALVESGQLVFKDGRWHRPSIEKLGIPQSIRVAIQARAGALSATSREVLEQAAVLGRTFDLPTLQLATDLDEEALIETLEDALAAQLIEEERGEGERFSFVHALIPASLIAGLRALSRRRMQCRAATALETVHPDDYEVLAYHFVEAGQIDKGNHYLLLAGDRARVQCAHEEAIDNYHKAIEYLKEHGQLEQAAHTLMKLGLVYNNAFDFVQSRQAYQEGFALWQQTSIIPSADSAQPASHPLRLRLIEPTSLDQSLVDDTASGIYIDQLFSGLLQLTPEMDVIPDVAHSWEVLHAGRRYRFHLRDDVFWSDG
ncbi:MAG: protein kinase, partial [Anaerolineaceae bacterium]